MVDSFVRRVREEIPVGDKYQLLHKLGSGSGGSVYLGCHIVTGEEVAIKLEDGSVDWLRLEQEVEVYRSLGRCSGFPRVHWCGEVHDFTALVFDLLGPSLQDLFQYCNNQFSLKTTLLLADQILRRIEALHSHKYLHQDIKPANFLMGTGVRGNIVYMTDMGLAVYRLRWSPPSSPSATTSARELQLPGRESRLFGTCRYASIRGHFGVAQSRGDDLESLGYMLIYFMKGKLPWRIFEKERNYSEMLKMKQTIGISELCADLPSEFADYMNYVYNLPEGQKPNYRRLRTLFTRLFRRQGFEYDNVYDWTLLEFYRLEGDAQ